MKKKMLTEELENAMDTVCLAYPYISDCDWNEELVDAAYADYEIADAGAKYCERCMVRHMYNLYDAMDNTEEELPYSAPEWQAIINY